MCGITGVAALPGGDAPSHEQLAAMCDVLVHRGPDEEGIHIADGVGLGMRRLSIIDVEGGHQPIFNEDASVRAIFNGEIYNFRQLRDDLEAAGHKLRSGADGEVLVHLWEEHGPDLVHQLNGIFAIAIHDVRRRRLCLIRDRLGIKPLFYAMTPRHLVFGSEIPALLASGRVGRDLDLDALGQFFAWEYVPAPRTLFAGVRKLEPGTLLDLDLETGVPRTRTYWDIPSPAVTESWAALGPTSDEEWEERVAEMAHTCVRRQLVSDVPLGAFLSGGVDSSLVVSQMGETQAFSIGFNDPTYDESDWARRVARHLDVRHRVEILEPNVSALFDHLMDFMADPIADFSIFPTYLVSRLARREVKVVLTGDGGDELFGGYETYLAEGMARAWQRLPRVLRESVAEPLIAGLRPGRAKKGLINKAKRFVEGLGHDAGLGHARWRLFVGAALRRELFTPGALENLTTSVGQHILDLARRAGPRSPLDRALYIDAKSYLAENCLAKVDRMSMACSLEARVPLLDHKMVELAFRLPTRFKVHRGKTKILLKRVTARQVPEDCVYRPKEGFSIPIKAWLQSELRPLMEELLGPARLSEEGIFQVATVDRLKREHLDGRANHSHLLWALMVFQDWRRRWRV